MYDVITVGSSTIDVFAHTNADLITIRTEGGSEQLIAYPSGTKIVVKELKFMVGGGGTNTAVAFSRLGLKTAWLSKLGKDENGERIINEMKKEKVDFIGPRVDGQSGYSVVLDSVAHDRTILTYKGVNDDLTPAEVPLSKMKAKWFYFSSMTGKSFDALAAIAAHAHQKNIPIAFNPSSYLAKQGADFLKPILQYTTLLVLNKEEAQLIAGNFTGQDLAKRLQNLGPKNVVITDGANETVCLYDGKLYRIVPHKVEVVESTGAGDAFASSLVAGLIKNNDIVFALKLGLANTESVLAYVGAKNKLLTWGEALAVLQKTQFSVQQG
ncbi:MAG: carbohydrate kinase family protein [Nanoarchaeota archaeon]